MKDLEEQRVCVKFCLKSGKNFTETFQMLQQAYGEDCLSRTQCYEWYRRFKSGRMSIEDDPKSGRPSSSTGDDHIEKGRCWIVEISSSDTPPRQLYRIILSESNDKT